MPNIKPFVVAIWCGEGKPTCVNEYIAQFVDELNALVLNGILINENHINVLIRCFICDTPARAFLKGVFSLF